MTYTLDINFKKKEAKKLLEYLKSLSYLNIKATKEEEFEVPDWHKKIVLNRIKTAQKKDFLTWPEVKAQIKHK